LKKFGLEGVGAFRELLGRVGLAAAAVTFLEPVGFTPKFEDVTAMGEPVQQGAKQTVILKDLSPFREWQVGGNEDGGAQIQVADQGEEHLCALLGKRDEAQFVDDDKPSHPTVLSVQR